MLICLILFFVSVAGVSAAEDMNQTVVAIDENVDANLGMMPIPELQELIDNAKEGSVVELNKDYDVDFGYVEINKSITIDGKGHYIDSHGKSIIFDVTKSNVCLNNIQFLNWGVSIGSIGSYENNFTISNCIFKNITSISQGIVYSNGSDLTVDSCKFIDCSSHSRILYSSGSNLKITNTDFINSNMAIDDDSLVAAVNIGTLLVKGDDAIVSNCRFINNRGCLVGAIEVIGDDCEIKYCSFLNNKAVFPNGVILTLYEYDSNGRRHKVYYRYNDTAGAIKWRGNNGVLVNPTLENNDGYEEILWLGNNGQYITNPFSFEVPDVIKNYGGPERLEITLTKDGNPLAGANINVNINGVDNTGTTDNNGKVSMPINLNVGNYDAVVSYGDVSTTAKVIINKLVTKNTLSYTKNSHNSFTLTALIDPSTVSGDVVFTVNGKDYAADKVVGGKATRTLSNLAVGNYEAKASYKGDVNHKASTSGSVRFTVEDVKVDVIAPDLTKYYHGPEKFVVTVKEDNKPVVGKAVTIALNGKPYTRTTDSNGQASMAINLDSGVHQVTSEFEGIKVQSTITVKPTVSGNDVTKIYRNDTQYYATFRDSNGNLLKNTDVNFNINGVFYTRKTNDQGVAKMNINLNPDEYIITAINPVSTEQSGNVIKVLPSIVENHDLTKYYKNASRFTFRLLDGQGKPVGAGVSASLNINGVFYTRQTDANGYIKMNINLNPGTYIATIMYNGLNMANTIKVLPILEAKDVVMKYRDGTKFEAKLLDGQGKPFAGQTITFNINGVMYNRVTDGSGVARLNLNLMAGEYIIT